MLSKTVLIRIVPIFLNIMLILWTVIVSPHSKYGDNWAVYPIVIVGLVILIWHIGLIFLEKSKLIFAVYGLIHLSFSFIFWIYCLMKISKDAL